MEASSWHSHELKQSLPTVKRLSEKPQIISSGEVATSGSCRLTQRSAERPVTAPFPGGISREKNPSEKKKNGEFQEAALIERIVQQSHQNRILLSAIKERGICKRFAVVSGFIQTTACWDTALAPNPGLQRGIQLGGAWKLLTALLQKPCLMLREKRAKKRFLGSSPEDPMARKAFS